MNKIDDLITTISRLNGDKKHPVGVVLNYASFYGPSLVWVLFLNFGFKQIPSKRRRRFYLQKKYGVLFNIQIMARE